MRQPGRYIVNVLPDGSESWERAKPRRKNQPKKLPEIWRHDAPVRLDYFFSELQRYGFLSEGQLKIKGPQFSALHYVLIKWGCIRDISLRCFYLAVKTKYALDFSLRAASGRNKWEEHLYDFDDLQPTNFLKLVGKPHTG